MAADVTIPICGLCQAAPARSAQAVYCHPCFSENKKRIRTASAARQRRAAGASEIGCPLKCERCGQEATRGSGFQRYCKLCKAEVKAEKHRLVRRRYDLSRPPRIRNKPEDKERRARWAQSNRNKVTASVRSYNERNREEINRKSRERSLLPGNREKRRQIDRLYRSRPKRRIDDRMKTAIQIALRGRKSGRSWETLVGYTIDELIVHLERQFTVGMSWDNIGRWHIDHILPRVMFEYESSEDDDFKACWSLTNLRPLWSKENIRKGGKRLLLV